MSALRATLRDPSPLRYPPKDDSAKASPGQTVADDLVTLSEEGEGLSTSDAGHHERVFNEVRHVRTGVDAVVRRQPVVLSRDGIKFPSSSLK